MYPSKSNTNGDPSSKESEASKLTAPPTDFAHQQSSNPSAPLLPQNPNNPSVQNMEPPPYNLVVAQDSSDWKNRSSSFSGGNYQPPYSSPSPSMNTAKSTSGLDNQAPYPSAPGPAAGQTPYPTGGYSGYGPPAQAPYPTGTGSGPEVVGNAPYPGSGITSQPPYPTGPGYIPGPASQAPYPVASMPIPGPVDPQRQIGFTAPVTIEPKPGYPAGGYGPQPAVIQVAPNYNNGNQGVIYPTQGENNQYVQSQYVPNQYGQQQQPNTIYVVHKNEEQSRNTDDDCCFWACCLASCYCLCECIKICASGDD